jgi:hypothetical protein
VSIPWGYGVRFLYDAHLRYFRPGLPTALRIRNYVMPTSGYVELGFQFSPTGNQIFQAGFTDVPIVPPVEVWNGSSGKGGPQANAGLNQARLMTFSKTFIISHTFVLARMDSQGFTDPYQVWRDPSVIGLFYNTRLFSIEDIVFEEIAGQVLAWTLTGNAQEPATTVVGGP